MEPLAGPSRMVVQMRFPTRARGPRVRMQNALNEYKREMKVRKEKYQTISGSALFLYIGCNTMFQKQF